MSDDKFFNPDQKALNLVLPVKAPIAENAAKLREVLTHLTPTGLNNVGTVHFGRFLFMNNDSQFLVFTAYDGTFEKYIEAFINETGDAFNAMLSFLDVPDGVIPVESNRQAFYELIKDHDLKEEVFYCAYPEQSVIEIIQNAE
jgi:hypothetical protein